VIVKLPAAVPALQLTDTRAVPALVVEPISHVQVATPLALAVVVPRPLAVLSRPLGSVTASVQESRDLLECTVSDSCPPGAIEPISEVIVTAPDGGVVATVVVVVTVGGVGLALGHAPSALPSRPSGTHSSTSTIVASQSFSRRLTSLQSTASVSS
jgi:hypothetical protein